MDNILLILAILMIAVVGLLAIYCYLWVKRMERQEHSCPCCIEWEEN